MAMVGTPALGFMLILTRKEFQKLGTAQRACPPPEYENKITRECYLQSSLSICRNFCISGTGSLITQLHMQLKAPVCVRKTHQITGYYYGGLCVCTTRGHERAPSSVQHLHALLQGPEECAAAGENWTVAASHVNGWQVVRKVVYRDAGPGALHRTHRRGSDLQQEQALGCEAPRVRLMSRLCFCLPPHARIVFPLTTTSCLIMFLYHTTPTSFSYELTTAPTLQLTYPPYHSRRYENFLSALLNLSTRIYPDEEPTKALTYMLANFIFGVFDQAPAHSSEAVIEQIYNELNLQ